MRIRRALMLTVLAALVGCGASTSNVFVPDGAYTGSTSTDREIDLQVNSGEVKLDGKVLKRDAKGVYHEHKRKWSISCSKEKGSKDISCHLTRDGVTETVELMRL